ncbi:MAG: DUF547 domain-containing protein [Planctomycetota bacterium]
MKGKKLIWVLVGAILIISIGCAFFAEDLMIKFFGPPEVELKEAYASNRGDLVFDHGTFDDLLKEFVRPTGEVDYDGLQAAEVDLANYLDQIANVHFANLPRDGKLALMLNAYNAFTLRLILEYRPGQSIRQIPEDKRWKDKRWIIGGRTFSLEQLEHEELRAKFIEPRIHFAINCASKSCPKLRNEAYIPARVNQQLEDQARAFHDWDLGFEYKKGSDTVLLSRIYLWYRNDFEQAKGSLLEFVAQWSPDLKAKIGSGDEPSIEWISYDWSLNRILE